MRIEYSIPVVILAIFGLCHAQGPPSPLILGLTPAELKSTDWSYATNFLRKYSKNLIEVEGFTDFVSLFLNPNQKPSEKVVKGSKEGNHHFYKVLFQNLQPISGKSWDETLKNFKAVVTLTTDPTEFEKGIKQLTEGNYTQPLNFLTEFQSHKDSASLVQSFEKYLETMKQIEGSTISNSAAILRIIANVMNLDEVPYDYIFGQMTEKECSALRELSLPYDQSNVAKIVGEMNDRNIPVRQCRATPSSLQLLINDIKKLNLLFADTDARAAIGKIHRYLEYSRAVDLLAFGCGDVKLTASQVISKLKEMTNTRSRFVQLVGSLTFTNKNEMDLDDSNFRKIGDMFNDYKRLSSNEKVQLEEHLRANRLYAPLAFLQKMGPDGRVSRISTTMTEISKCTTQKLQGLVAAVGLWKELDSTEALHRVSALFEASKCDMLSEAGVKKHKAAIDKVVKVLEESFGLVSCRSQTVKTASSGLAPKVQDIVTNMKLYPLNENVTNALEHIPEGLLKVGMQLNDKCLLLRGDKNLLPSIMEDLPELPSLDYASFGGQWLTFYTMVRDAHKLYAQFEELTLSEETQLWDYLNKTNNVAAAKTLRHLEKYRYALDDFNRIVVLMDCRNMPAFLEIAKLWKATAHQDVKDRIMGMLQASHCEVVKRVERGHGGNTRKIVDLMDKEFGADSCRVKRTEREKLTRVFPSKH